MEPQAEMVMARPAAPLRRVIASYRGYRSVGPAGLHRGLPSSRCTFIVSLDEPVDIAGMPAGVQAPGRFQAFVGGLHAEPATIRHDGRQHGISIELTPLGVRALFGMPAGELAYAVVDLEDLFGPDARTLVDRLVAATGWRARFDLLDRALAPRVLDTAGPPPEVVGAWHHILATDGAVDIASVARDAGYSRRHLTTLFRRELGLAPKTVARVARFERSRALLQQAAAPSLTAVAATCGYYDQAHLTREWRDLAGCPPTVWMAEELPSVQGASTDVSAD